MLLNTRRRFRILIIIFRIIFKMFIMRLRIRLREVLLSRILKVIKVFDVLKLEILLFDRLGKKWAFVYLTSGRLNL